MYSIKRNKHSSSIFRKWSHITYHYIFGSEILQNRWVEFISQHKVNTGWGVFRVLLRKSHVSGYPKSKVNQF